MRNFIVVFLLLLCSFVADAKTHSMLNFDGCAKSASNIIVVKENNQLDGRVTVLESLLGKMKVGDSLDVSELARFKSIQRRQIFCSDILGNLTRCVDQTGPKVVSGGKVILFLKIKAGRFTGKQYALGAVWIEKGVAYVGYDGNNAWDGSLVSMGSEEYVRNRIANILSERKKLTRRKPTFVSRMSISSAS